MTAGPARVSLWRYSPAIILFAIVVADLRQLSDADLWVHILSGRELLSRTARCRPPTQGHFKVCILPIKSIVLCVVFDLD